MSLETDLFTVLSAVCPRVYPDVAPPGAALPYVTWQQIGGSAPTYVEAAQPDKVNGYIQINTWAATRLEANTLARQIETALVTSALVQAKPMADLMAAFDEDTELRGSMQDFDIWAAR